MDSEREDQLELMMKGELYDSMDPCCSAARAQCRDKLHEINYRMNHEESQEALKQLLGSIKGEAYIERPFYCDYGSNIHLGDKFYANTNCVILDCNRVDIGDRVLFGPGVHVYCAEHPIDHKLRAEGLESSRPVRIGDDVWVGGHASILPGVTVGARSVIAAGAVVNRDVPEDVLVAGVPARVVKLSLIHI